MRKRFLAFCTSLILCATAHPVAAVPVTIDFDGFEPTANFSGGSEDGFNLSVSDGLAVDGGGAPFFLGPFSGRNALHNQTLELARLFISSTRGPFELSSLMAGHVGLGTETLILSGISFSQGLDPVGVDRFSLPQGGYALFTPTNLAGRVLDLLIIDMDPDSRPIHIDDIVLNPTAVPEPGTLVLFGLGATWVGATRRRISSASEARQAPSGTAMRSHQPSDPSGR